MVSNGTYGYSFAPTADNAAQAGRTPGTQAPSTAPVQTLNFKLPQFKGAGISPLMSQQQAGSPIASAVLESVGRTVLGANDASAFFAGSPAASQMTSLSGGFGGGMASYEGGGVAPSTMPSVPRPQPAPGAPDFGGYGGGYAMDNPFNDPSQDFLEIWRRMARELSFYQPGMGGDGSPFGSGAPRSHGPTHIGVDNSNPLAGGRRA